MFGLFCLPVGSRAGKLVFKSVGQAVKKKQPRSCSRIDRRMEKCHAQNFWPLGNNRTSVKITRYAWNRVYIAAGRDGQPSPGG